LLRAHGSPRVINAQIKSVIDTSATRYLRAIPILSGRHHAPSILHSQRANSV
jgi:hypothetical protein